jgi:hypothetical protein
VPARISNPHVETKVCANAPKRWQEYRSFFHLCLDGETWRSQRSKQPPILLDSVRETCLFVKVRAWSNLEVSGSGKDLPCIQMATDEIINWLNETHLMSILIPKIALILRSLQASKWHCDYWWPCVEFTLAVRFLCTWANSYLNWGLADLPKPTSTDGEFFAKHLNDSRSLQFHMWWLRWATATERIIQLADGAQVALCRLANYPNWCA